MHTKPYLQTSTMSFPPIQTIKLHWVNWFQFNVGKMHTLNTDNLFNLKSLEPDVQDQLIIQFIERVYANPFLLHK